LVEATVTTSTSQITRDFTFIMNAGSATSYVDFNQFRLYDPITKVVIGTADLPGNGFKPASSGTTGGSNVFDKPATPSTPAISGNAKVAVGGLGIFGAAMLLF
jgi:hypothetical protein